MMLPSCLSGGRCLVSTKMRGVLVFVENRAMSAGTVKLLQSPKRGLAIWVERADISTLMNL